MEISDIFHTFAVINTEAMKKEKRYPPVEEEENGLMAGEPAVGSVAYASTSTMSEPDYDFIVTVWDQRMNPEILKMSIR